MVCWIILCYHVASLNFFIVCFKILYVKVSVMNEKSNESQDQALTDDEDQMLYGIEDVPPAGTAVLLAL